LKGHIVPKKPVFYHLGEFPPKSLDLKRLTPLIGPAAAGIGRYDGLLSALPNAHILLAPLTTQEAVLSSKIEGTQVTMGEVLEIEAGGDSAAFTKRKREDAEEVLNYRAAMQACSNEIQHRSFSQQILRAAHGMLMKGVRGEDMSPGAYRNEQNWIGPHGCKIEKASFVPVPPEHLQYGMDLWERYFASTTEPDALLQLAILHVEFEALHPFKDGNGRLGRMLIPLFLFQRKLLHSPDFYISGYLEAKRDEYIERLLGVSRDGDWTSWCEFFLHGVREQAAENERRAKAVLQLYEKTKEQVVNLAHSEHAIRAVDSMFKIPTFTSETFTKQSRMPKPTADRILRLLRQKKILATLQEGKGRRPGIYAFRELLNVAEGKKSFEYHP
jgi:Fic family protein